MLLRKKMIYLVDWSVVCVWYLHGVLHRPREGPGIQHAGRGHQAVMLVIKTHTVYPLLTRAILIVSENLK